MKNFAQRLLIKTSGDSNNVMSLDFFGTFRIKWILDKFKQQNPIRPQ